MENENLISILTPTKQAHNWLIRTNELYPDISYPILEKMYERVLFYCVFREFGYIPAIIMDNEFNKVLLEITQEYSHRFYKVIDHENISQILERNIYELEHLTINY